jgi:hypothetical protein
MNWFLFAKHAEDRAPSGCGPQARWLCCSLLTYRIGYASSLAPRQRALGACSRMRTYFCANPKSLGVFVSSWSARNKYHQDTKKRQGLTANYSFWQTGYRKWDITTCGPE